MTAEEYGLKVSSFIRCSTTAYILTRVPLSAWQRPCGVSGCCLNVGECVHARRRSLPIQAHDLLRHSHNQNATAPIRAEVESCWRGAGSGSAYWLFGTLHSPSRVSILRRRPWRIGLGFVPSANHGAGRCTGRGCSHPRMVAKHA